VLSDWSIEEIGVDWKGRHDFLFVCIAGSIVLQNHALESTKDVSFVCQLMKW